MRIIIAQHLGLCFGVRDAIARAEDLARKAPLTILGELVHNPIVHEQLKRQGVQQGSLDQLQSKSQQVMITAHGASDWQRDRWTKAGYQVADATCPLVLHVHEQLKRLVAAGYFPVIIGKRGHIEVRGLTEDFSDAFVFDQVSDLPNLPIHARYGIISQTTQPIDHVRRLVETVRERHPEADIVFVDTVCKPTKDRQVALQALIAEADTIVVVGGRRSNNTRQLVQTCRLAGRRTIHIERPEEVQPMDFCDSSVVGLTAGTSTLPETVTAVWRRLQEISSAQ
ncbi:MAG TPA: 4-hydroxy-3-methylbut-2-enyl diphosphate reductase [Chthoniobacterales bacterium]|jgi:4-hydroxy-3-methylbut-2-enyl diphosphate reductase